MEMRDYEDLKKKLCKQLEEIARSNKFDMGDIEAMDKLIHSIKNIGKIEEQEGEGYSQDGGWNASGTYSRAGRMMNSRGEGYADDSYANRRGTHYVRGHYSRATESFEDGVRDMMDDPRMTADERNTLSRALDILRK